MIDVNNAELVFLAHQTKKRINKMSIFHKLHKKTQENIYRVCDVIEEIPERNMSPRDIKRILKKELYELKEQGLSDKECSEILVKKHKELLISTKK